MCAWCILLQTIFYVQKLDHDINWSWAKVFIPSYLIFAALIPASFLNMIFSLVAGRYAVIKMFEDHVGKSVLLTAAIGYPYARVSKSNGFFRFTSVVLFLVHATLFAFTVMTVLKLDGSLDMGWSRLFVMVYVCMLVPFLLALPSLERDNCDLYVFVGVGGFLVIITLLLMGLHFDEKIFCSFHIVFLPAYIISGIMFFLPYFVNLADRPNDDKYLIAVLVSLICIIVVSFLGPLGSTLSGNDDKKFALSYVVIFITEAILLIAHLFSLFVLCLFSDELREN